MANPYAQRRARNTQPPQPASAPPKGPQTMRGLLKRFVFESDSDGFKIARFVADEEAAGIRKGEEIVVTGSLESVNPGETLEISGQWTHNPRFGYQFTVESYIQRPPATLEGVRAFLGSGLIAGIGKEFAKRIVAAFGEQTLEIIDKDPGRLHEVDGIGPLRLEKIRQGWEEHRGIAAIMAFLQSYNISANWASRIYRTYGNDAVGIMRENPYRLAIDMRGIGFQSADRIAQSAGIAHDAPQRVQAAIFHLLTEASGDGHTFYPFDDLTTQALEMLGIDNPTLVREATSELVREKRCFAEKLPEGDKAVYLMGLHLAETGVAEHLLALHETGKMLPAIDAEREMHSYETRTRFELAPQQRRAVGLALRGGLVVLTGGPGTGKTTTIRAILSGLRAHGVAIALAAPTGRAAKRLSETTHIEATTIHRMLKWDPKNATFTYNTRTPLPVDYVVVDEASMLDIALTHHLLKAIPPSASLLLVGDIDQLPSVGPGNVLRDLIDSGIAPVVRLETIFRQARQSLIVQNAHQINHGEMPVLPRLERQEGKPDFLFVDKNDPEEALKAITMLVTERLPQTYGFDPIRDIQVITPMHRSILGAANLNLQLQQILNPNHQTLTCGNLSIRPGDKVMQCRNNYDKDVFNGDIGVITAIDRTDHVVRVRYENRIVEYGYGELDDLTLSYAITVHKSQGSEYPAVVLPIHTQHFVMLQRNLLYTAITRGKRLVVCVGNTKAISIAVKNAKIAQRNSGLRQRLAHRDEFC